MSEDVADSRIKVGSDRFSFVPDGILAAIDKLEKASKRLFEAVEECEDAVDRADQEGRLESFLRDDEWFEEVGD